MKEQLPYEDKIKEGLNNLPLPDEDAAWEKMKRLLEKEKDDRTVPPFFFLKSCGGWGLLFVLVTGLGLWFILKPQQWLQDEQVVVVPSSQKDKRALNEIKKEIRKKTERGADSGETTESKESIASTNKKTGTDYRNREKGSSNNQTSGISDKANRPENTDSNYRVGDKRFTHTKKFLKKGKAGKDKAIVKTGFVENKRLTTPENNRVKDEEVTNKDSGKEKDSTLTDPAEKPQVTTDTINRDKKDLQQLSPKEDSVSKNKMDIEKNGRKTGLGIGLMVQQQIPFNGQKAVPYNYLGRKSSLADYMPSVYLRLYRDKWFVQSEFRYGAPQYTREFVYTQQSKSDSGGISTPIRTTTSYRLKKTYYHQVPASLNYFIKPNWSAGAGFVYSRFYSAISEEEIRQGSPLQGDTLVSKKIVSDKRDSLFRRSNLQALLETQYHWKRFSFGARYTHGLKPYIQYTDAAGVLRKEINHSLQVFIRYELWRQKR